VHVALYLGLLAVSLGAGSFVFGTMRFGPAWRMLSLWRITSSVNWPDSFNSVSNTSAVRQIFKRWSRIFMARLDTAARLAPREPLEGDDELAEPGPAETTGGGVTG